MKRATCAIVRRYRHQLNEKGRVGELTGVITPHAIWYFITAKYPPYEGCGLIP